MTAGAGAGISDQEYMAAGAEIMTSADQIFQRAELIVKVTESLASERKQNSLEWCSASRMVLVAALGGSGAVSCSMAQDGYPPLLAQ